MLECSARSFTDPDDYASSIRGVKAGISVFLSGVFTGSITKVDLHRLMMQRFSEVHPRIMNIAVCNGRTNIAFHAEPGPSIFCNGTEVPSDTIRRCPINQWLVHRTTGPVSLGTMSLSAEDMFRAGITIAGCDLTAPGSQLLVKPQPEALARLRKLHQAVGVMARDTPEVVTHPAVARGLEQALIEAMVRCLATDRTRYDTPARRRHQAIMQRFHRLTAVENNEPLYILEIAQSLGVSLRSLSACCLEHLGMGAKRYLMLRRMYLTRQTLLRADPKLTTVTDVATQFGFWQFGRFSVQYKHLFGESPSATLHGADSPDGVSAGVRTGASGTDVWCESIA